MKSLLLRQIALGFLSTLLLKGAFAQSTPKEIIDKFFTVYPNDPGKAIDYGFSTNKWMKRKQDDVSNLKNKLKNLIEVCGDYYGYELLSEKTAGTNIIMATYIVRYEREPIRFTFFLYRPKDSWQLNNFSIDEDIDEDLKEAAKAYRLKENINW